MIKMIHLYNLFDKYFERFSIKEHRLGNNHSRKTKIRGKPKLGYISLLTINGNDTRLIMKKDKSAICCRKGTFHGKQQISCYFAVNSKFAILR